MVIYQVMRILTNWAKCGHANGDIMFITHIYDKDFNTLNKTKVIGSLTQAIAGTEVKVKQIPNAREWAIYKGYELKAFSEGALVKMQNKYNN